jgi:predicted membrane protein
LLFEFLEGLANSQKYWFSSKLRVDDYGVEIEKSKWFGKKEKFYYKWSDVAIWNEPGKLCIGSKDKKVTTDLSYQYVSNVHILEAAIRAFFKKSSEKMSSLLEAN